MQAFFDLPDEEATIAFSSALSTALFSPLTMGFQGDLGTGKTSMIRGMLRALHVKGSIKSPTFSLVESYAFPNYVIHHFDLYRLSNDTSLDALGFRDYFSTDAICCIEWPEYAPSLKPYIDVLFSLEIKGDGRRLSVMALSLSGETLLNELRRILV